METRKDTKLFANLNESQASGGVYTFGAVLNMLLSFVLIAAIGLSGVEQSELYQQNWYLYAQFLISPICIAVLAIFYFTKTSVKPALVFAKCKAKYYFIAILLQLGLFSLGEVNSLFLQFLQETVGYQPSEIVLPNVYGWGIVGVLFVVALLPAVLEELFFRGMLLRGTRGAGIVFCVLISGALFSLYHQNPAQTVYQFICGVGFALVAYRSGSVFPTVVSHFLNNAAIVVMYRFGLDDYSTPFKIPFMIVCALSLISAVLLLIFDKNQPKEPEKTDKKQFFLYALGGIALCGVTWLTSLLTGL